MVAVAAFVVMASSIAHAQRYVRDVPPDTEGIGIVERLDERISLDVPFLDQDGNTVTLGDYLEPGRPIILTLNYYTCPQLCHLTLNALVRGLNDVEWTIGEEFRIVTVSINPDEGPEHAASFKRAYGGRYQRDIPENGWSFLVGDETNIRMLADEVGFQYRFVPETEEYAHPSSIIFITPDGRIARYINHIIFEPRDLRMALVESSEGRIGTRTDRLMLFLCYEYDPDAGSYVMAAWKIMRAGGILTMVFITVGLFVLWLMGSRYERKDQRDRGAGELALSGGNP
jgi:protein SCO1